MQTIFRYARYKTLSYGRTLVHGSNLLASIVGGNVFQISFPNNESEVILLGIPKKRLCFKRPSKQLVMCSTHLMEIFLKNNILQQLNNNKSTIHKNQLSPLNQFSFTMTLTTKVFMTPHTLLMITSFLSFSKSG